MNILNKAGATLFLATAAYVISGAEANAAGNQVQPVAVEAMEALGTRLRSLRSFAVQVDVTTTAAIGEGRYRNFTGTVHYVVKRPDHLAAIIHGEGMSRRVLYDGRNIIVHDPVRKAYARVQSTGYLQTLLDQVKAERGVELPIGELFTWGTTKVPMATASRARYEGTGMVGGQACEHYSYLANGVTWEV